MRDINVAAIESAVDIASKEADAKLAQMEADIEAIRDESEVAGIVKASNAQKAYSEFVKYASLYGLKQRKDYKSQGMTWAEYCERIGESQRSVDRILNDIGPIVDDFSAKLADTLGLPFNKIRMLGKKVGEGFGKLAENELIINDEIIPLTPDNKDEIVAAIDSLVDTHKKEQKELKAKLDRATKETDKIVDEATKGLTLERDALIKEVGRLKPFDPSGEDVSWSKEHMEKIHELTGELAVKCRQFIMDDRLKEREHRQLQAQVEMYLQQAEFALQDLRADWMDKFVTE